MTDTPSKSTHLIYSPRYNIGFFGFERLHPFDSRKYGRAWRLLRRRFGPALKRIILTIQPALNCRGVKLSISHQMGNHVFNQPLITGTLLVPRFYWEAVKILLEAAGFSPKQVGSFFPRTHRFTPQSAGSGYDSNESLLYPAI